MNRVIIFPSATLLDKNNKPYEDILDLLVNLNDDGDNIVFLSHNPKKLRSLISQHNFAGYINRRDIRNFIKENQETHQFIIVGSSDVDLQVAASCKILLINPLWSHVQEAKPVKYGIGVKSPGALYKVLQIFYNHHAWYYELEVDDNVKVYSLASANTMGNVGRGEKEIIEGFQRALKEGNKRYYKVLLFHFLAAMVKNEELKDVDIWAIMPSSGTELNEDMLKFKEHIRFWSGKRSPDPLFIRHTAIEKSRGMDRSARLPCDRHFDTIIINPVYKEKLEGKTVCVLDDFLNNGTSFETLRNLLIREGVKKIVFVTLGRFKRSSGTDYLKQDYKITGDVYEQGYKYKHISEGSLRGTYNEQAKEDIRELYKILHS